MKLALVVLSALLASPAMAQQPSPDVLVAEAIAHLRSQQEQAAHYIADDTFTSDTRDRRGRSVQHYTSATEFIFVDGQPYARSITRNGVPMTEPELEAFRARVKADRDHREENASAATNLDDVMTPDYRNSDLGHETVDGRNCLKLQSLPGTSITNPLRQQAYTFWLDATTHALVKYSLETLADQAPQRLPNGRLNKTVLLRGNTQIRTYRPIDGVWLAVESYLHTSTREQSGRVFTMDSTALYTNYRRFKASATISPIAPEPTPPN